MTTLDIIVDLVDSEFNPVELYIEATAMEQSPDYNNDYSDWDFYGGVYIDDYELFLKEENRIRCLSLIELSGIMGKRTELTRLELETKILEEYKLQKRLNDIEDSFFDID